MKDLFKSSTCHVQLDGVVIYINNRRFGFRMTDDEGVRRVVIHKKYIEKHASEYGFLVPKVLINCAMLFEVQIKEGIYTQYHYYPKNKNRLIPTGDHVFIGLGPLDVIDRAEHIKKVSNK